MTEVLIPYGDSAKDTATLLLAAAEEKGYEPWVVRHQPEDGGFRVPEDVAKKSGLKDVSPEQHQADLQREAQEKVEAEGTAPADAADQSHAPDAEAKKAPAKKTAKRAPAKKTAAKKTAAKKSTSSQE